MSGERVLIVDDEPGVRSLLSSACQGKGYEVVAVEDGSDAVDALDSTLFDVCVLDLRMPGLSGIEVLRHAKDVQPDCEVIILTGYADLQSAIEALRLGAYDYLQKPVGDLEHLSVVISRALERRRLARGNRLLIERLQMANNEIERRRRRELSYIQQIGQAMASALDAREIVQVLTQAILNAVRCDAAGALLLHGNGEGRPWALISAHAELSALEQRELMAALIAELPDDLRPHPDMVDWQGATVTGQSLDLSDRRRAVWKYTQFGRLVSIDALEGIIGLASRREEDPQDSADIFGILLSQGSTALSNSRLFARTKELAIRDGLTGLYNHRHFFQLLEAEIEEAEREEHHIAVIMVDLDRQQGLKAINDSLGHLAGDELLRQVGQFLVREVRHEDVVARYGGDEFVVLARDSGREEALALAHRICHRLSETTFDIQGVGAHVTASIGVGVFEPGMADDVNGVVSRSDRGLYMAKERGGDQVCFVDVGTDPL